MLKRVARVALSILRLPDGTLIIRTRNLVKKMTGNPSYPTPAPDLASITTAVDAFEIAAQNALTGGTTATLIKTAAKAELISLLRQLSFYVQLTCQGDLAVLVSSGFEATKTPVPAGNLPPPGNVRASYTDNSGEVALNCDKVINAASYQVQSSTSPDGPWEDEGGFTSTRIVMSGFTPGVVYWFTIYAIGAAGDGALSSPISLRAI